jgi:GAF domain-containing protein
MANFEDQVGRGLVALSQFFVGDTTFQETLTKVSALACQTLSADMAGITMLMEGRPRTGVFTDAAAPEIDQHQYDSGRGPCLQAFRDGLTQRVDSTVEDNPWLEFSAAAAAHGIMSSLSLPVIAKSENVGALNLYSREIGHFKDESMVDHGEAFAAQAAIVLLNAQAYWDARELSANMDAAMASRAVIEQAKGILMAPGGRSPEEAFAMMVRASQRENRKLRDVALELVNRAQERRPPQRPPSESGGTAD